MSRLPTLPAHRLSSAETRTPWLIESLWSDQAVGIIGGEPKCCKSFLALDMAVAVASGAACLRRFKPAQTGRVLLFAAEDSPHILRQRLEGICHASNVRLSELDIQVLTVPSLRLDSPGDRECLRDTVAHLRPMLLLLDPFVRLHRSIDENASAEVAPVLGYLRYLQRQFQLAVVLVHHARKASHHRAGQALRGSSDFHAWGDSNLYLRRRGEQLTLTIEHRAAPSADNLPLVLDPREGQIALRLLEAPVAPDASRSSRSSVNDQIELVLAQTLEPLSFDALRQACRVRTALFCAALRQLQQQDRVLKTPEGYRLATSSVSLSRSSLQESGSGNRKLPLLDNCADP